MKCSAERLIEAIIGIELARQRKQAEEKAERVRKASYVVTVSRSYGSLGGEVAGALAERLGVRCCDRVILEEVARRADVDVELMKKLDENVRLFKAEPWTVFFSGKSWARERYLHHLVKVVLNISGKGGVILGRGAHMILGPSRAFRIRIIGTPDTCARRVAERKQLDLKSARKLVRTINRGRDDYMRKLYGAEIDDVSNYDLVINSDRFGVPQIVELVLLAMRRAGYEIPDRIMQVA
jgi:cytidylate kinase